VAAFLRSIDDVRAVHAALRGRSSASGSSSDCERESHRSRKCLSSYFMSVRQLIFGELAIRTGIQVSGVDLATLLRRLLLFDTVIIRSIRLREALALVRAFGRPDFLELVDSGVLKISCEWITLSLEIAHNGVRELPPSHFSFGIVDVADRDQTLRSELRLLQGVPGLKNIARTHRADMAILEWPAIRAKVHASQPDSPRRVKKVWRKEYKTNGATGPCLFSFACSAMTVKARV